MNMRSRSRATGPIFLVLERQLLNEITRIAGSVLGAATFLYCGYTGFDAVVAVRAYSACQAAAAAAVIPVTLLTIRSTGLVAAE
jgi:hypothetical protein